MASTLLFLVSLVGAAALGFLTAWFYQGERIRKMLLSSLKSEETLRELKADIDQHFLANESLKLSLKNLERLLESYENQATALESELVTTRKICEELYDAHKPHAKPQEIIKEIEVIREVPVLVFRDKGKTAVTHEEKAAKLVRAFKKGVEVEVNRAV